MVAGYLTEEDLDQPMRMGSLADHDDTELTAEVERRMAGYRDVVAEMRRRYETDDPRKITFGSADDVFPPWGSGDDRQRRSRFL